ICLLITCTLLLTSCGIKELPSDKQDYVGTWTSENTILTISKSAKVEYKKQLSDVSSKSVNGPIKKFDGNNFIVGALGIETVFVVSETPHMEAGVIKMTVDGEELVKQE
ncbi:MAG TPA: hypothetical protein VGF30_04510, partial [Bacteroidia bacterium]